MQRRWRPTGLQSKTNREDFYHRMCTLTTPSTYEEKESESDKDTATSNTGANTQEQHDEQDQYHQATPSEKTSSNGTAEEEDPDDDRQVIMDFIRTRFINEVPVNPEDIKWQTAINIRKIEQAILELARKILNGRAHQIDKIVGTADKVFISPASKIHANTKYSFLAEYKVPKESIRVLDGILKDLFHLNYYYKKTTTLSIELGNNMPTKLVLIPQSSSIERMRRNNRKHKWVDNLLEALSPKQTSEQSLKDVLTFLATANDTYRQVFIDVCKENGFCMLPRIDEASTFAIQSQANLSYRQMRELRRMLHVITGSYIFAPEYKLKRLADDFVEPTVGEYQNARERIPWSCRDVDKLTCYSVQQVLQVRRKEEIENKTVNNKPNVQHIKKISNIQVCDIVVSIDHGKGYSRATLLVVLRYKEGNNVQEDKEMMALANAKCRKDNYKILSETFAPMINAGLKRLKQASCLYVYVNSNDESSSFLEVSVFPPEHMLEANPDFTLVRNIPIELWMAGDAFFSIALGKEGSSTFWCIYCKLFRETWRDCSHDKGEKWDLREMSRHLLELQQRSPRKRKSSAQERKGFKEDMNPLFDSIAVDHYVVTVLHLQLGMVNTVYNNFMTEAQYACEVFDEAYRRAETELYNANMALSTAQRELTEYEESNVTTEQELKRRIRRSRMYSSDVIDSYKLQLDSIEKVRHQLIAVRDCAREKRSLCQGSFEKEAAKDCNSKSLAQPVRAMIEDIVRTYGIDKGAYHGGDIQGPGCRKLMRHSEEIFTDIEVALLALPEDQKRFTDNQISFIVNRHMTLLSLMDGMFSLFRTKRLHLTSEDIEMAIEYRDTILEHWRYLGLSVTPKVHVLEDHAVELFEQHQGFGDIGEDFGERAHQTETRNEKRVEAVVDQQKRETTKCKDEALAMLSDVRTIVEHANKSSKRQLKKVCGKRRVENTETNKGEQAKRRRQEYRDSLLEECDAVGDSVVSDLQLRLLETVVEQPLQDCTTQNETTTIYKTSNNKRV